MWNSPPHSIAVVGYTGVESHIEVMVVGVGVILSFLGVVLPLLGVLKSKNTLIYFNLALFMAL